MLTRDRPQMAARAVAAFRRQTYERKRLLIWDTGELNVDFDDDGEGGGEVAHIPAEQELCVKPTIGALRNRANAFWNAYQVRIHWDDDDLSHPNRIAEQVALLQSSGADCVGYNECLFWREPVGEAWLYSNRTPSYAVGSSLCYWRKTWERHPFPDLQIGEDKAFLRAITDTGGKVLAVSSMPTPKAYESQRYEDAPRLICSIHAGNSNPEAYKLDEFVARGSQEWKRAPQWDDYARDRMAL